ncbi:hypothetical protein [Clostridium sp. Cult3]|uniref:hypothetical protein n=1 Tax=Clostridium sp. Cult3 TaxID=2079004 RepID=UPI001F2D588C|nr:hypothetical protein [Clostridium sp. Cult3]
MIRFVERIVFSGVDGRVLLPLLIVLVFVIIGQAEEFIEEVKDVWKEGENAN